NTINLRAVDSTCPTATITQVSNTDVTSIPQAHIPAVDCVSVYVSAEDNDGLPNTTDVLRVTLEYAEVTADTTSLNWTVIDSFACTEDYTDPIVFAWDTHQLNSDYVLRARITDWEVNECVSTKVTIKVEGDCLTMPWITIPRDNSETRDMVTVSAITYETGVHKVKFEYMDASDTSDTWYLIAEVVGSNSGEPARKDWIAFWDTTGLEDGDYLVQATSTDIYLNKCIGDSITVTIDNTISCAGASISAPAQIYGDDYIPGPDDRRVITLTATLSDTHDIAGVDFNYDILEGSAAGINLTAGTPSADSTTWTTTFRGTHDSIPLDYYANIVFRAVLRDDVGNTCAVTAESLLLENKDPISCIVRVKDQNGGEDIFLTRDFVADPDRFTGDGLDFLFTASDNKNVDCVSLAYFELDPRLYLTDQADSGSDTIAVSSALLAQVDTTSMLCLYDTIAGYTVQTVKVMAINGSVLTVRPAIRDTYSINAGVGIWVIDSPDCEYPYQANLDVSSFSEGLHVFSSMSKDIAGNVKYPEWKKGCSLELGIDHQCPTSWVADPSQGELFDTGVNVTGVITSHQGAIKDLAFQHQASDTTSWTTFATVTPNLGVTASGNVPDTYKYFDENSNGRYEANEAVVEVANSSDTTYNGTQPVVTGDTTNLTAGTTLTAFPDNAVWNTSATTSFETGGVVWIDANGNNAYDTADINGDGKIDWAEDILAMMVRAHLDINSLPPTNGTGYALRVNDLSDYDDGYRNQ
ncbi:MAG: hypothetical protein KKD66_26895, partial [Proteobacteria bacterium]|nr:hypothetical protein [Pseudomonadota bacterium]